MIEELPGRVGSERPPRVGPEAETSPPASAETDAGVPPSDATPPLPAPEPLDPLPPDDACGSDVEREELALTNAARADYGLAALECDLGLTQAARKHSEDMCNQGYFSHTSRDGRRFDDRIRAEGVIFGAAAENIAMGQQTPEIVHASWMRSSGHRANILGGNFRRIGIGHVECPGGPLWTQNFAD